MASHARLADGHDAVFAALALHAHKAVFDVHVLHRQTRHFLAPDAAAVKQFHAWPGRAVLWASRPARSTAGALRTVSRCAWAGAAPLWAAARPPWD